MYVGYGLGVVGFNFGNQSDVGVFHSLNHPIKKDETIIGFVLTFYSNPSIFSSFTGRKLSPVSMNVMLTLSVSFK
jgi:hypothetical protein